jgi:hypothetical protein
MPPIAASPLRLVGRLRWASGIVLAALLWTHSIAPAQTASNTPDRPDAAEKRQQFLAMFARAYFPGRSGQLMVVPREGDILTRHDPEAVLMHGSPWSYDVSIPLLFVGPSVSGGSFDVRAVQQDVAPTLAAALGIHMPPTATGRVLPVLRPGFHPPRAVMLIVLDGMRRDYFDRDAGVMPTLTGLRKRGAWFTNAEVNVLPTNTAVGHATISTGADPGTHGIVGNNVWDSVHHQRVDLFAGMNPQALMAMTLSDVWQLNTAGRAVILVQGSIERAATSLAGHGACQLNGSSVAVVSYDRQTGRWTTRADCFRMPAYLAERQASALWRKSPTWMGHRVDSTSAIRHTALFPAFEADAMTAMIEREPIGQDSIPDLILLNAKSADFVGHKYGPDSKEVRETLREIDRQVGRLLKALEAKVGQDYLLAITADHGMPARPSSEDRHHFASTIVDLLHRRFDPEGKLVPSYEGENAQIYVDRDRLAKLGLHLSDLARFLETQPYLFAVFTEDEVRDAVDAARSSSATVRSKP